MSGYGGRAGGEGGLDSPAELDVKPGLFSGGAFGTTPFSADETARMAALLSTPLSRSETTTRPGPGGARLTYIEGWRVISDANEIFGFNGWSSKVLSIDVRYVEETAANRYNACVCATVRITLRDGCSREDRGGGTCEGMRSKGDALLKAEKEAVTDATKRALKNFGLRLGLSLYDRQHVREMNRAPARPHPPPPPQRQPAPAQPRPKPAFASPVTPAVPRRPFSGPGPDGAARHPAARTPQGAEQPAPRPAPGDTRGAHAPGAHAAGGRATGAHAPGGRGHGGHAPGAHAPGAHAPGVHAPGGQGPGGQGPNGRARGPEGHAGAALGGAHARARGPGGAPAGAPRAGAGGAGFVSAAAAAGGGYAGGQALDYGGGRAAPYGAHAGAAARGAGGRPGAGGAKRPLEGGPLPDARRRARAAIVQREIDDLNQMGFHDQF